MSRISKMLSRFCYSHPKFAIPNLMKYIVFGNLAVWVLNLVTHGAVSGWLSFIPGRIMQGQIWRLVSFVFVPLFSDPLYLGLSLLMYFYLGNQLERAWGSTRFTVYYLLGVVLTALLGLVFWFTPFRWYAAVNMHYVNLSLFLAFATLYPDMQFRIYFIIPIRGKWLAIVYGVLIAFDVFSYIGAGQYLLALVPVVSLLNYLLFFWDVLRSGARNTHARVKHQTSRQTVDFHAAQRQAQQQKGYLHKCVVCGITDADDRNMEFRYCSKCSGYHCYCANHINAHTHIQ